MLYGIESLSVSQALLIALSGLIVVFIMLGILALVIMVISKVVGAIDSKRAPAPAPKKAAPAPAAAPKAPAAPAAPAQDQDELVAVLMAAIAAETDSSPDSFRITSVQSR